MNCQNVVVALTTRDNDYQAEQSASAAEVASRLGVKINVLYADNNAVDQCQQLVKVIQDKAQRPDAILVEPVGTPMYQVAKAAVAARGSAGEFSIAKPTTFLNFAGPPRSRCLR